MSSYEFIADPVL